MGAWIEILHYLGWENTRRVAPFVGAWIEITGSPHIAHFLWSLPSWERGLKLIKMIEEKQSAMSLPSWERGLKLQNSGMHRSECTVAPFVGAWIEIAHFRLFS